MPEWIRVKDKETGHHYTVAHVDTSRHEVLKDHKAVDANGRPLPTKHNVNPKTEQSDKQSDKQSGQNAKENAK